MGADQSLKEVDEALARDGFCILPKCFTTEQVDSLREDLAVALQQAMDSAAIRSRGGRIYAARNLLTVFPSVIEPCRQSTAISETLSTILGSQVGLVRGLYFDKPPEQTWALPWHQDRTIAVVDNQLAGDAFRNPTRKAGIPHVEAPDALLQQMATLRIHLDDADKANGALRVLPGSHTGPPSSWEGQADNIGQLVEVAAGDVLLMRPMLAHCSGSSAPENKNHRRVIHLEFAATRELADGFQWHSFTPLAGK